MYPYTKILQWPASSYQLDDAISLAQEVKFQGLLRHQQENLFMPSPSGSPRRTSNRNANGGFTTAMPLNRRLSLGLQQLGPNSIDLGTQGISKEGKKGQRQTMFVRPGLVSPLRDETASVVSTFSGPLSP